MIKWLDNKKGESTINGATYYFEKTMDGGLSIYDISVQPGVKTVAFGYIDSMHIQSVDINPNKDISFPDVENLNIGKGVLFIRICNNIFPNINHVSSQSSYFKDNVDMLIYRDTYFGWRLLNSFCKKKNEVIDLSDVNHIDESSLSGCKSKNVINADSIRPQSFNNIKRCNCKHDKITGAILFGNIILEVQIKIRNDVKVIEIPDDRYDNIRIINDIKISETVECLIIHKYETLEQLLNLCITANKIILDNSDTIMSIACANFKNNLMNLNIEYIDVNKDNHHYKTIDGVLYSKDMKALMLCPLNMTGCIIIPDGVETISKDAFCNTDIETVVFPKSIKYIEDSAFQHCVKLHSVCFNEGLEYIGHDCFMGCENLTHIEIPSTVKVIGKNSFEDTFLNSVKLNEGLQVIEKRAFKNVKCVVNIPKSLQYIGEFNFLYTDKVYVTGEKLPRGLLSAVMTTVNEADIVSPVVEIHTNDGVLYIPRVCVDEVKNEWLNQIEKLPLTEILKNKPHIQLLQYIPSISLTGKVLVSLQEKMNDNQVKEELNDIADDYTSEIFCYDEDDGIESFKSLLNTNVVSTKKLKKILRMAQQKDVPAFYITYTLNKLNEAAATNNNKFNL